MMSGQSAELCDTRRVQLVELCLNVAALLCAGFHCLSLLFKLRCALNCTNDTRNLQRAMCECSERQLLILTTHERAAAAARSEQIDRRCVLPTTASTPSTAAGERLTA